MKTGEPSGEAGDAFARLRHLLDGIEAPPGLEPIRLHLGEQRLAIPLRILSRMPTGEDWSRYPQLGGGPGLRAAYAGWLTRRFGVGDALEEGLIACEPTPGSKQAIAAAILLAVRAWRGGSGPDLPVVLPNPFYPTYLSATRWAGARPHFYDPQADDVVAAVEAAVARAQGRIAAVILCSPGSPSGRLVSADEQRALARLARRIDATLIVDECYIDLALSRAPAGFLPVLAEGSRCRALVLHTLSKRSGAPGLRSGFLAGDRQSVAAYAAFNRACGVSLPGPVATVSEALWRDDAHVGRLRRALQAAWRTSDAVLGDLAGYARAESGFFVWLPVGDDELAAQILWREAALMTMPGRFLGVEALPDGNPGAGRLRVALVHKGETLARALRRLRDTLLRHDAVAKPGRASSEGKGEESDKMPIV